VLIGLPATSVVVGISLVFIAMHEPDGLVVDDYYKQGMGINQTLERDRVARFLGLHAEGRLTGNGRVQVSLSGKQPVAPGRLHLRLLHPTRANLDQTFWLERDAVTAAYSGAKLAALKPGNWHVLLEPEQGQWRLTGRMAIPGEGRFRLQPIPAE
jgi:hypothetical protein